MATFEVTRSQRVQQQFEIIEIDLPVINGTCTLGSAGGYGTPLFCDQAWTSDYKTYYFTNTDAPVLPSINGEPVWRCVKSISETSSKLKPGEGLASRSSAKITLIDFKGQDPNPDAQGVTASVKQQGTFFGKLDARQILADKAARIKLYRVEADGSIDLANGAQTRHFLIDSLSRGTKSDWSLSFKDVLSSVNLDEKTWPEETGGFLRQDIDDNQLTIEVDGDTDYSSAFAVRIGEEILKVSSVTNNLTPTAELVIASRSTTGVSIFAPISSEILTRTYSDEHSAGDEVFICGLSDDETLDDLIARILTDSGIDSSLIPAADWAAEVAEWHSTDKINTLHVEAIDTNEVIAKLLTDFLMDLWFDPVDNEVKLSAISVWKQSTATLTEGKEINAHSVRKSAQETMRASRAIILYDKSNITSSDDSFSYTKASRFSDNSIVSDALYPKHKDKEFDNSQYLNKDAADLLTQRYVSRFKYTPFMREFKTDERYLNFATGDVVDITSLSDQSADGSLSNNIRGQIVSVNPKYSKSGRHYNIKALTYEAAFTAGSEIVLSGALGNANLYILGGAPSQAVELTFVLDGGYSEGTAAIRAGNFVAGSKLTIIMVNGFNGQANGGSGGSGEDIEYLPGEGGLSVLGPAQNGFPGGTVFDCQGVDCDFYFSGATPSTAYPTADGYIRAPSGGDGGFNHTGSGASAVSGNGGDGGDGRLVGVGGLAGAAGGVVITQGLAGVSGQIDGSGTGWGNDGAANGASSGGLAGSGIVDGGATTVNLYGTTAARYINGSGDHP
jgi:hypothetical protein